MRPIAEATARITGKTCSRKYIALGRIVNSWSEIVGPELAKKAQPVKINYMNREKGKNPAATLDIGTSTSDATLLFYQKDLILERLNQLFGEGWITAIRFVNVASNLTPRKRKIAKKPLTEEEKTSLSGILGTVQDEAIRKSLESLGSAVFLESTASTS